MNIITIVKDNKYIVIDNTENIIAEFSSLEEAKNFIVSNEDINPENIIENPFYEVDEDGQPIGSSN
jgi:hypothetical protein